MDILNSKNSKTSDPHGPLLNLTFDLRRKDKYIGLSKPIMCYTWKNFKKSNKKINLNNQLQY